MSQYHEPIEELSARDRDIVRALESLKEEVEAVNWYHQRVAAGSDQALKDVLAHNRDEEIEHACMAIEWLRRNVPAWEENLRTYLFTDQPITEVEESAEGGEAQPAASRTGDLGIGSLKEA